jgi:alpha-L-fucosidase 2
MTIRKVWMTFSILCVGSLCPFAEANPALAPARADRVLWSNNPAEDWKQEAYPIGNGGFGAMLFGGVPNERVQFNADTLWVGDENYNGFYQSFGDLFIEQPAQETYTYYRRELDLPNGIQRTRYTSGGVTYTREAFASRPAGVVVIHLSADKPGAHTGRIRLTDVHDATISATGNQIVATGSLKGYKILPGRVKKGFSRHGHSQKELNSELAPYEYQVHLDYESQVRVLNEGGSVVAEEGAISFKDCDSLTIVLAGDTNFEMDRSRGWTGAHPHDALEKALTSATAQGYDALLTAHLADYRALYDRFALELGSTPADVVDLPTYERVLRVREGAADPDLEELLYQFARYLMIGTSRQGAAPANLQGLWNDIVRPPWRGDYHSDVNLQMNYWFVDQANLSDCFSPLAEWIHAIRDVKKEFTKKHFGEETRGWATRAANGLFGGSCYLISKGDAAWLTQNLWDHYAFTLDEDYLRNRAYPVMKELCEFWQDTLKELPDGPHKGKLVSPDGFSPEHGPIEDGVSFDQQLVWDLFTNFIEASEALGEGKAFRKQVAEMKSRLLGPQVGSWGQLQEWMVDRDSKKGHRHVSHMIAIYPGRQISPQQTPEFAEAARVALDARAATKATGWGKMWRVSLWSRLGDGERAHDINMAWMKGHLPLNLLAEINRSGSAFQIDANFGYAAGVNEILLQSHLGYMELLPTLPKAWANGSVKGMKARGAFLIDMAWEESKLKQAKILSGKGADCRLKTSAPVTVTHNGRAVHVTKHDDGSISFPTESGTSYVVVPR